MSLSYKKPAVRMVDNVQQYSESPQVSGPTRCIARAFEWERRKAPIVTNGPQLPSTQSVSSSQASEGSHYSGDVDRWIRGSSHAITPQMQTAAVQNSRPHVVQRSVLAISTSTATGFWYLVALALPLLGNQNYRCYSGSFLGTADILIAQAMNACDRIKNAMRIAGHTDIIRQFFALVMDVILVIYAVGFIVISMYEANVIA